MTVYRIIPPSPTIINESEVESAIFSADFIAGFKHLMQEVTKTESEARHAFEQFFDGEDWNGLKK
jgi:hypothetical protein